MGDVGGSSNDPIVEAFGLDNLILVEPNDDAHLRKTLMMMEMMMKLMIFMEMILLED